MRRFSKALWASSVLFGVIALSAGYWLERGVSAELQRGFEQDLSTILESNVEALKEWMMAQERAASLSAAEPGVREVSLKIIDRSRKEISDSHLFSMREQYELRVLLQPTIDNWEFESYVVIADGRVVGTKTREAIRQTLSVKNADAFQKLEAGTSVVSHPQLELVTPGEDLQASMWVASPIRDNAGVIQGALAFRIDPYQGFNRILRTARWGKTGETYAFDESGLLLSGSRFDEELRIVGLLNQGEESALRVRVREPGAKLTVREQNLPPGTHQPLTHAVRSATRVGNGVSVRGYRGYRGIEVIGAWAWLDDYALGVVTEIQRDEAFASVAIIRRATWGLCLVLFLVAGAVIVAIQVIRSLQKRAENSERLGQYTLEKKLGQGGMGTVYKARHALLRRPTAIKVIRPENINERTRKRFEREVQATSKLCHPNTIAIYDYGHSRGGVFYYAMEFLGGIDLHDLVKKTGRLPEARVIHILRQIVASLAEAHDKGMVHRDIKPPNIMLCRRGGMADVIKVLDFGLVKELESSDRFTLANALTGTPQYMAPEAVTAVEKVDRRTDIYAVGAVGFFLLAGRQLFVGPDTDAVLAKQVVAHPPSPSQFTEQPVTPALEALLLCCLEKDQDKRPSCARALLRKLEDVRDAFDLNWTQTDAEQWWKKNEQGLSLDRATAVSRSTTVQIDMKNRDPAGSPLSNE